MNEALQFYRQSLSNLQRRTGDDWNMITIDGVVGVGKSTLMELLVKEFGFTPFEEPVADNPILDRFYYDRSRYSFPLQVFFLNERFKHIKKAGTINNAVLDRSIYGDVIFAKMLHDAGEMTTEEFSIYQDLFENMLTHCQPPKLMIYLEVSPAVAVQRIKKRGRSFELDTEFAYWERLNREYETYFKAYNASPILKINVDNLNFESNPVDREKVLQMIRCEIKKAESLYQVS